MHANKLINDVIAELIASVNNNFTDNYDYYRFGPRPTPVKRTGFKAFITARLNEKKYFSDFNNQTVSRIVKELNFPFTDFFYLYNLLEDDYSKDLLVKIIAYRILGNEKVKLPLSTPEFWSNQQLIESNQDQNDFVAVDFMNLKLPLTDLKFLNVPLKMYYSSLGINIDFIIKQYELNRGNVKIQAEPGDIVIDAGGCFGDTALYFANLVGKQGKVFSFEFIPKNLEIFTKNLSLNPEFEAQIKTVTHPLWNKSGLDVYYTDNGPGSKVSLELYENYTGKVQTITIDDYVQQSNLPSVEFIKMDIEGAETNALVGAVETIKKYKPKLAIALYHSTEDFERITRFIHELHAGYKFYLSHSTIYGEETMLFATV